MDNDFSNETVKKKKNLSLFIWILPIVALFISSWMIIEHLNKQAEKIIVHFDSADGFEVNKTQLKYRGIKIGVVSDIGVNHNNLNEFIITLSVSKEIKSVIAREGSMFWKVEPKASLTKISGLNTILSGAYIDTQVSSNTIENISKNKIKTVFKAVSEKPINFSKTDGVFFKLSSQKGSLSIGAPVLYKSFIVGEVLKKSLNDKGIKYTIFIKNKYKNLIKDDTNFWNISGFDLKASLSGVKLRVENLATLVAGGIEFDSNNKSKALKNSDKIYKLHDSKEDVLYSDKPIILVLNSKKSIDNNLSQIKYNNINIGKIVDINHTPKDKQTKVTILLKKKYLYLLKYKPYFHIFKHKLSIDKLGELKSILNDHFIDLSKQSKKESDFKYNFTLYNKPKKISMYSIVLKTNDSIKIGENAPVYFKDIEVGNVSYKKLNKKSGTVIFGLDIFWKYRYLINDSSLFYLESPIEIQASINDINIKTSPLKSFIKAGIEFETPNLKEKSTTKHFELFNGHKIMLDKKYLQSDGSRFTIEVDELTSLNNNVLIYYKGVEAGKIVSSKYNEKSQKIDVEVFVFKKFADLINKSTRFYSIGGIDIDFSLEKVNVKSKSLSMLFKGAISFITLDSTVKKTDKNYRFKYFKNLNAAKEKYIQASITMHRGFKLRKGSKILYKDMIIGKVNNLEFTKDDNIIATIDILKTQSKLLKKDTIFYLDDFKFGITKIENPDAVLFGPKVSVVAGKSDIKKRNFTLVTYKPIQEFNKNGLRVIVNSNTKSSLKQNSPVYYRQLQIGAVEKYTLSADSTKVKLQLLIDEKYEYLVRENSIFYNAGAFGVDFYLFGVKIKTETLETLVSGGISMVTPTEYGEKATYMKEFELHPDIKKSWLKWAPKITRQ